MLKKIENDKLSKCLTTHLKIFLKIPNSGWNLFPYIEYKKEDRYLFLDSLKSYYLGIPVFKLSFYDMFNRRVISIASPILTTMNNNLSTKQSWFKRVTTVMNEFLNVDKY